MKRVILFSVSTFCFVLSTKANNNVVNHEDSLLLKQRIEYLEKQVATLDSHVKMLHNKLTLALPVKSTHKKMVIDRRGSKQVRFE
jgi:hypothetical protein